MSIYRVFHIPLLVVMLSVHTLGATTTLNVPATAPTGASKNIPNTFMAIAIQASSFSYYAGVNNNTVNTFTKNLFQNIQKKIGTQPVVRVGGTNGDMSKYNPNQTTAVTNPATEGYPAIPSNIVFGPLWYTGFSLLPVQFVYGVPFAGENQTNTVLQTNQTLKNINSGSLSALEIGNEPDEYGGADAVLVEGPSKYDAAFKQWAQLLLTNCSVTPTMTYQGLALGQANDTNKMPPGPNLNMTNTLQAGLDSTNYLKSISIHYYQTIDEIGSNIQSTTLNHTYITKGLTAIGNNAAYLHANYPALEFVMGETGRDPANKSVDNVNTFGGALWAIDMLLYATTINVERVNMQQGAGLGGSGWHPTDYPPYSPAVLPPYYSYLFVADAVGNDTMVQSYQLSQNTDATLPVYAFYSNSALKRIAILNLVEYEGNGAGRGSSTLTLNLSPTVTALQATKFLGPAATATGGFAYGGNTYAYPAGTPVSVGGTSSPIPVTNGVAKVEIENTAAFMLSVES